MNTFLGVLWGLIDPDMFASVADTLEDVMQASVPGVIENVRVAEVNFPLFLDYSFRMSANA